MSYVMHTLRVRFAFANNVPSVAMQVIGLFHTLDDRGFTHRHR
jgi:hypothetical protein